MYRRLGLAAALVVFALAVTAAAGCGDDAGISDGSSGEPAGPDTGSGDAETSDGVDVGSDAELSLSGDLPDPCGLLTTDGLVAATGITFGEAEPNIVLSGDDQAVCGWVADDPFSTAQVLINTNGDDIAAARQGTEEISPTVDIDIGEDGFRTDDGSLYAMRVGSLFVQVAYIPNGPGSVVTETDQLARAVVARIP